MRGAALMAAAALAVLLRWDVGGGGGCGVLAVEEEEEFATVRVAQGFLKGRRVAAKGGGSFFSFQGVPYARPPVGPLRFQIAQPPESWEGVREVLTEGPTCIQLDRIYTQSYLGEEDCLYLNVYTPKLETASNKYAVMLWIHGGGFISGNGNSDLYGPDYLVNENVILVTINYRLGVFGFLHMEDQSVPANLGLKDQVAALRWVQENIIHFGGDPNRVTIFGESAGGAAVHYHIMSPMSKGLFHKAISQSGCALNPWAMGRNTKHVAFELAKELGYRDADHEGLVAFLKSVPAREMVEAYAKVSAGQEFRGKKGRFGPVIETNIDDPKDAFLTSNIRESMENGKYNPTPSIFGFNSKEGLFISIFLGLLKRSAQLPYTNENVEELLDQYLEKEGNTRVEKKRILETYFGNDSLPKEPLERFINYLSDEWFFSGIDQTVKLFAASSQPIYYYNFAFYGQNNFYMKFHNFTTFTGPTHLDELPYLFRFRNKDLEAKPESPELLIQRRMVQLWTNFAKSSNPTPTLDEIVDVEWHAYSSEDPAYLNIDTALSIGRNIHKERMDFWNSLEL